MRDGRRHGRPPRGRARASSTRAGQEATGTVLGTEDAAPGPGPATGGTPVEHDATVAAGRAPAIRVLVVDDSQTQAEALRLDLEAGGFAVTVAHGGEQALSLLSAGSFDLVVSDVVMPGMDGYQLCAAVKGSAGTRSVPVVLLTALTDPLDVVHGLEAGADNYIRKPYAPDQLVSRIMTTLHNRDRRQEGRTQMGIQLSFLDRQFTITAERQQILDLLITTFEELVMSARELRARERALARAEAQLAQLRGDSPDAGVPDQRFPG